VLNNVLHVPEIAINLISVSALTRAGYSVSFEGDTCLVKHTNGNQLVARRFQDTKTSLGTDGVIALACMHESQINLSSDFLIFSPLSFGTDLAIVLSAA